MAWLLAGKTIRVDEDGDVRSGDAFYAIQGILDATAEVISYYGAGSERRRLRFFLLEDENGGAGYSGLEAARIANADVNLTSDEGSQGNFRILSLNGSRKMAANHSQPVYDCTVELIKSA